MLAKPPTGTLIDWSDPLTRTLRHWWPMGEGMGRAFEDPAGRLDMALAGTAGWGVGPAGYVGLFPADGTPDGVTAPEAIAFTDWTLCGWFNLPVDANPGLNYRIISHQGTGYLSLTISNNQLAVLSSTEGLLFIPHGPAVNTGTWHHGALVRDTRAGLLTLSLDGEPVGTNAANTLTLSDTAPWRSSFNGSVDNTFYGMLEGLGVFAGPLPQREIRRLASSRWPFAIPRSRRAVPALSASSSSRFRLGPLGRLR